jgi:hypothetical protein
VQIGYRRCNDGEYVGLALICWDLTTEGIDRAHSAGANLEVTEWARQFVIERKLKA